MRLSETALAWLWMLTVFAVTLAPTVEYDVWYDIRMGREICATHSIPHLQASFLGTQREFGDFYHPNDEWGFCVFVFLVWSAGGTLLMSVATSTLLALQQGVLFASCGVVGCPVWARTGLLALALFLMRSRLFLRPQLITDLCLALTILALLRAERDGRAIRWWAFGLFFGLWANMHAGYMICPVVLGIWAFANSFRLPRCEPPIPRRPLWLAWVASLAAPLATPSGWRFYEYIYHHFTTRVGDMTANIEWQPPSRDWLLGPFGLYLALGLAGLAWTLARRRLRLPHLAVFLALGWFALRHLRAVGELSTGTPPLAARSLAGWPRWERLGPALLVGLIVWSFALLPGRTLLPRDVNPEGARALLEGRPGTVFNSYHFGGWMVFADLPAFIHGMTPGYPPRLIPEYMSILQDPARQRELFDRYHVTAALMHYAPLHDAHEALVERLAADPRWSLVDWDDSYLLFLRDAPPLYRAVLPSSEHPFRGPPAQALAELNRKIRSDPDCRTAWRLKAEVQTLLGQGEAALASYREMTRRFPEDGKGFLGLGSALFQKGELQPALAACREAVRLVPDSVTAQYNLAVVLTKLAGQEPAHQDTYAREAERACDRALRTMPDYAPARNLRTRLRAAMGQ